MHKLPTTKDTTRALAAAALAVEAHRLALWHAAPPYLPDSAVTVLTPTPR